MYDRETRETYERAGFAGSVRRGTRRAVVVVDLSCGFTEPEWPTGCDLTEVVETTGGVIRAAHEISAPVILTTIAFQDAELDAGACVWLNKAPGLRVLREGSELVDIDPRLPRAHDDLLITKKGASAFFGTNLAAVLAGFRIDTAIFCGATTSGCIRASVVDAVQSGFPALVARECVGDRAQGPHDAALFDMQAKYADVVPAQETVDYLHSLRSAVADAR